MTQDFTPQLTTDGSFTFFSTEFGETFHSLQGARKEAQLKFVEPTQLKQKAPQSSLKLLDVCYGLGYNTAAALETIWDINPKCYVELIGLELDPTVPAAAPAHQLLNSFRPPIPEILTELATFHQVQTEQLQAQLLIGDARKTIQQVQQAGILADAIFLDPFSPPSCPQLWTVEFLNLVAQCLKPDGRLATYSCAAAVRTALMKAGLHIGSTPPVGRKSPSTVACFTATDLPLPSVQEQEHLQTRAAIPYRDPHLGDNGTAIWDRRQLEQQSSSLEPTSHWKKRWSGAE